METSMITVLLCYTKIRYMESKVILVNRNGVTVPVHAFCFEKSAAPSVLAASFYALPVVLLPHSTYEKLSFCY